MVAVSGGVDSVVLLDLLNYQLPAPNSQLIVAHFDHGIRADSQADRIFVQGLAEKYALEFEYIREELGTDASEALARERRYLFLRKVQAKYAANAIVTAHHRDDEIETACINLLRGTFRKGVTSLASDEILRPLLPFSKDSIIEYAKEHNLTCREDASNQDPKYLRNEIRARLQKANPKQKTKFYTLIQNYKQLNNEIDSLVEELFSYGYDHKNAKFSRLFFISLPYNVSCELLAFWLRTEHIEFDKRHLELLVTNLKTGRNGTHFDAGRGERFVLSSKQISLEAC